MAKILRVLGAAATFFFFVSVYTPVWNYVGAMLILPEDIVRSDAIVVLGAGMMHDGSLSDESLRRLFRGMELFKEGMAETLIVAGPRDTENGRSEAAIRRDIAAQFGIPVDRIQTIDRVTTTRDEAQQANLLLESRTKRASILLVTEALHIRRAKRVFEKAGFDVHAAPSDDEPAARFSPVSRIELVQETLEQTGALIYYRIAGYL